MHVVKNIAKPFYNKIKHLSSLQYYLITCYFLIFGSLGSNIINLLDYQNINNIYKIENLRSIFPIIILIINFYYIFKKKIEINTIEKIFIGLILTYLSGTLINLSDANYFKFSFLVNPLALITTYVISKKNLKITYTLGAFIFFISSVLLIFYSQNRAGYGGGWISIFGDKLIFINSNGTSRLICFLNLLLLTNLICNKDYINTKTIITIICIIILTSLVMKAEGRVNTSLVLISSSIIFLNKRILFLKRFLLFLFIIFFAFCLSKINTDLNKPNLFLFEYDRFNFELKKGYIGNLQTLFNTEQTFFKKKFIDEQEIQEVEEENWNRFSKWRLIVKELYISNTAKIIFGSGPEHDRILLKIKGLKWNADAANGFLYSLLCGGIIGFFLFFLVIKKIIFNLYYYFYKKKYFLKNNYLDNFCFLCPLLLLLRSLFENGFSTWGVDFIIIIICLSHIENKYHLEN